MVFHGNSDINSNLNGHDKAIINNFDDSVDKSADNRLQLLSADLL